MRDLEFGTFVFFFSKSMFSWLIATFTEHFHLGDGKISDLVGITFLGAFFCGHNKCHIKEQEVYRSQLIVCQTDSFSWNTLG